MADRSIQLQAGQKLLQKLAKKRASATLTTMTSAAGTSTYHWILLRLPEKSTEYAIFEFTRWTILTQRLTEPCAIVLFICLIHPYIYIQRACVHCGKLGPNERRQVLELVVCVVELTGGIDWLLFQSTAASPPRHHPHVRGASRGKVPLIFYKSLLKSDEKAAIRN